MIRRLPLSARLTLLYTLVSASVLLGSVFIVLWSVDRHFTDLDQETLGDKVHLVQDIVARSTTKDSLQARLGDALHNHPGLYLSLQEPAGAIVFENTALPLPLAGITSNAASDAGTFRTWQAGEQEYRSWTTAAPSSALFPQGLRIVAVLDSGHHAHFMRSLQTSLWLYAGLALVASGMLAWWAAHAGLSPLRAMKARAQAVTLQKLDERMPVEAVPVEMADLALSLNEMLERLQRDFHRLSEFSSDLAHEWRTPISNLLTQTQVALAQPREALAYREVLASNAEELQRLGRMVSDMLLLAKAEHGLLLPSTEDILLAEEVQALFDFYDALAQEKGVQLRLVGDAQVRGDRLMLRRALSNLLSNALRHTHDQGEVVVAIRPAGASVEWSVENTGSDIDPDLLPRLFDRFFRADKSRSHTEDLDTEGAGLGLSITKAIVEAHGGSVRAESASGRTRFTLVLPIG